MNDKTPSILSILLFVVVVPACGTAVEQDPVPPTRTGAAFALAPDRSPPPIYYESSTQIDTIVARRMNMQMVTRRAIVSERGTPVEPTLSDACGWKTPTVYFSSGDAKPGLHSDATVDSIAACLRSEPLAEAQVVLVGYADARGSTYNNLELGLERANEVKQELVEIGVSPDRIETYSRGEYLVDGDDDELQDDRRVVVKLDR